MRSFRSTLVGVALASVALAVVGLPQQVSAQELVSAYPSRNILLVVPYPPGGPPDVIARVLGQPLAEVLGKPIVIENRPGASTSIGASAVARAAPDGYTLLASDIAQTVLPSTMANLSFDPVKDLKPVVLTSKSVFTVVIDPKLPIKSLAELVAYSKLNPEAIKAGHSGIGTPPYLGCVSMMQSTGLQMVLVPYRGIAQAASDVVAGHIQLICSAPSTTANLSREGKMRMLVVAGDQRLGAMPDVPTFKELGITLKGFDKDNWFGISVPAGTPDAIVDKLNAAFNQAIRNKEAIETLAKVDIRMLGSTPAEFAALFAQQVGAWREVLNAAGVKPE